MSSMIRVTTLANGLRVATDPMETVESAAIGIWIDVGARDEDAATHGASHFLEHLVFKGTPERDARAIAEEIEAVGGHLNAHTSREYTAYYAKVLKEDVVLAVDILADIVRNATLDPIEVDRERSVVVQEILQAFDTPDDIVFDRFQETAFPDQPLGRSVLGSVDGIRALPRDVLVQYRDRHYCASRMIVVGAGRIDHDRLVDLVASRLGDLPAGEAPVRQPARYTGGDCRDDRDLEQVHVILGWEGVCFTDPDFYPLSVMATLLGGGMSSRLFQEVREKRGLVYNIYTFPTSYLDDGLIGIYAGTGADEVAEVVPLICEETVRLTADLTDAEVARSRAQLKAGMLMALESPSARCEQLARQLLVFGRPLPLNEIVDHIATVDREAVIRVIHRLLSRPPTLTAIGPLAGLHRLDDIAARLRP
ncbi:MAG: insulinase family protein [Rhodospirillales bacterium]|nr:MAG: insulinase family protein [Rhodospirillales bacterium]